MAIFFTLNNSGVLILSKTYFAQKITFFFNFNFCFFRFSKLLEILNFDLPNALTRLTFKLKNILRLKTEALSRLLIVYIDTKNNKKKHTSL